MLQTDYKHLHLTTIIIITTARECYSPSCNLRPMRLRFDFGVWFNLFTMQFFLCNKLLWLVSPVLCILKPIALFPYCSAFTRPYQWCLLWCGYFQRCWMTYNVLCHRELLWKCYAFMVTYFFKGTVAASRMLCKHGDLMLSPFCV